MIFNKSANGSAELKELIGFIYKSINFDNLKSYVTFAQRDIIKIIGDDVFHVAWIHYLSDHFHTRNDEFPEWDVLDELVSHIQYPTAVLAYRKYVPSADLTHSDKGRQIFVSDQEKPAFEWQIEKDNENLLTLAHEAIDVLLEFLDKNIDLRNAGDGELTIPWRNSDAYKSIKELLIPNVAEFEKIFMIGGSRMTFLSLVPFIRRIQDNEIASCITLDRYNEIHEQYQNDTLSNGNRYILDRIRPPLALLALSVAVKRLSAEVLPAGIFSNIVSNVVKGKNPASKQDRNEITATLEKDGMLELLKLQEYIRKLDATDSGETFTTTCPDEIDPTMKFVRL